MASSLRPLRSQTLSQLLRGYRHLSYRTQRWLRQGSAALTWALQVALYPAYVALQGLRSASRRLTAAPAWRSRLLKPSGTAPDPQPTPADTPIVALLLAISAELPPLPAPPRSLTRLLQRSGVGQDLALTGWMTLSTPTPVEAIACDRTTRQLVLVTANNSIFSHLTPQQQAQLQRAIVLLLAEYGRYQRQYGLNHQLQAGPLPLPPVVATHYWPLRWLYRGLGWMQTSPLAIAANLFGEADLLLRPLASGNGLRAASPLAAVTPAEASLPPAVSLQPPQSLILSGPAAIEAQTTLLHYIDHPLIALLRSLDTLLVGLEGWLKRLFTWLRIHLR
ncbi:MAG: hypothetical protein ACOYMP_12265 [Nodosilinea sp.]